MTRYAVFSSDTNETYSFFVPIVALAWRNLGFKPLAILSGDARAWRSSERSALVLECAMMAGATVHFAPSSGALSATVAQLSRIFAHALPGIKDDDALLTTDADMLPLGEWVGGEEISAERPLQVYGANAYAGDDYRHYPMCYAQATAKTWSEIVPAATLGGGIGDALVRLTACQEQWSNEEYGPRTWFFDEYYLGTKIQAWWASSPANKIREIDRDFKLASGQARLDRSEWWVPPSLAGFADAHLPRPGWTDEGWALIRPVLAMALDDRQMANVDEYRERWTAK